MQFFLIFVSIFVRVYADCEFNRIVGSVECISDVQVNYFSNFSNINEVKNVFFIGIDSGSCSIIQLQRFTVLNQVWVSPSEPAFCSDCLCFDSDKIVHNCAQIPICIFEEPKTPPAPPPSTTEPMAPPPPTTTEPMAPPPPTTTEPMAPPPPRTTTAPHLVPPSTTTTQWVPPPPTTTTTTQWTSPSTSTQWNPQPRTTTTTDLAHKPTTTTSSTTSSVDNKFLAAPICIWSHWSSWSECQRPMNDKCDGPSHRFRTRQYRGPEICREQPETDWDDCLNVCNKQQKTSTIGDQLAMVEKFLPNNSSKFIKFYNLTENIVKTLKSLKSKPVSDWDSSDIAQMCGIGIVIICIVIGLVSYIRKFRLNTVTLHNVIRRLTVQGNELEDRVHYLETGNLGHHQGRDLNQLPNTPGLLPEIPMVGIAASTSSIITQSTEV